MFHSQRAWCRGLLALLIGAAVAAQPATARDCTAGNFVQFGSTFVGPGGSTGVQPMTSGGITTALGLDTTGDGIPDATFTLPEIARGPGNVVQYFLSPARRFVLGINIPGATTCAGVNVPGTTGPTGIVLMSVPVAGSTLTAIHVDCLPGGLLNSTGNGKWFESGTCNRLFVARSHDGTNGFLRFYDLLNATPATDDGTRTFQIRRLMSDTTFTCDSGGSYAFLQHDLASFQANTSDYDIISLCPQQATFGQSVARVGDDVTSGVLSARTSACGTSTIDVRVLQNGSTLGTFTLPQCCTAAQPPTMGSCCIAATGGCDVTTESTCMTMGGTWLAGGSCSPNPCQQPSARLTVSKVAGASSLLSGDNLVYTLSVSNTGNAVATGVTLRDRIPSQTTFVSASGGGTVFSGQVNWTIGTLAAGATATRTMTVRGSCVGAQTTVSNNDYSCSASGVGSVAGEPVNTMLMPRAVPAIVMTAVSTPARVPLQSGDTVAHVITMVNATPVHVPTARIPGVQYGTAMVFDSLQDAGGGVFNQQGSSFVWDGPLPPNSTTTLAFTTRVRECIEVDENETQLHGGLFNLVNPCFALLASTTANGPFALTKPLKATFTLGGVVPGLIGPVQVNPGFSEGEFAALVRPGASPEFVVTIENTLPEDQPDVVFDIALPTGLNNVMLTPPVAAGVTLDGGLGTVSFSGSIPGNTTVTIRFSAMVDPMTTECSVLVDGVGGTADCQNLQGSLRLYVVPQPAPPPFLQTVFESGFNGGPFEFVPSPLSFVQQLCIHGEIYSGLARASNGDVWIAGLPTFKVNFETLDFHVPTEEGVFERNLADGAVDPATGLVYFIYNDFETDVGVIVRYSEQTRTLVEITRDLAIADPERIVVDANGRLIVLAGGTLRRFDPSGPLPLPAGSGVVVNVPTIAFPNCVHIGPPDPQSVIAVAIDRAGDYLVLTAGGFTEQPSPSAVRSTVINSLIRIERATGAATVIEPMLSGGVFAFGLPPVVDPCVMVLLDQPLFAASLAAGENGEVYVAAQTPALIFRVQTVGPQNLQLLFGPFGFFSGPADLEWVPVPVVVPTCPVDFNNDGLLSPDDLDDFITTYFTAPPGNVTADFNNDGIVSPDDVDDFITRYFEGCP